MSDYSARDHAARIAREFDKLRAIYKSRDRVPPSFEQVEEEIKRSPEDAVATLQRLAREAAR